MKLVSLVGVAVMLAAGTARAEEPDESVGVGLLVSGGVSALIGAVNLAVAGLGCPAMSNVPPADGAGNTLGASPRTACLDTQIGVGAAFVAISVPLFIVGASKRSQWNDWSTKHVAVTPRAGGATVGLRASF